MNLENREERIIIADLGSPEGLALDWVSRNLYYVDAEREVVGVCSLRNGTAFCNKVIHSGLTNPRGIAVHPADRVIFFTQWGPNGRIERAWLDGSGRKF